MASVAREIVLYTPAVNLLYFLHNILLVMILIIKICMLLLCMILYSSFISLIKSMLTGSCFIHAVEDPGKQTHVGSLPAL